MTPADVTTVARQRRAADSTNRYRTTFVEVTRRETIAPRLLEAWQRLSESALEQNVFAEPWVLLPALEHFSEDENVRIGFVFGEESTDLLGVFPFTRMASWRDLPVSVARIWVHDQSYLGTPLLHADPDRAKLALAAFVGAMSGSQILELDDVGFDGEFMRLLTEVLYESELSWLVTGSVTRPVLRPRNSADAYLAEALRSDGRRKLRAKTKGLAALGRLHTRIVGSEPELEEWIHHFLRLEEGGWKGKLGTALLQKPAARRFFEACLREGFRRDSVMALALYAGSRPVALKVNLKSHDEWFAYKITYDEDLARYSPGYQLEVENIRLVHSLPHFRSMDSCTGPTTRVFRDLWLDRRGIQSLAISTGRDAGDFALAMLPVFRWGKQRLRRRFPGLGKALLRKPSPRQVAAYPLATATPMAGRLCMAPLAAAAIAVWPMRSGDLRSALAEAVRLQRGHASAAEFHDRLDACLGGSDVARMLADADYDTVRCELVAVQEPFVVRRVGPACRLGRLTSLLAALGIRLDFELLRAGHAIPPHGHSRVVSGFVVVEGRLAVRRYDMVESQPDSAVVRLTFDGPLQTGEASTESDSRDNVHWVVALEDSVLFRITACGTPEPSSAPVSLNVWLDPRAPERGNGNILARWIPEATAREIPAFVPATPRAP